MATHKCKNILVAPLDWGAGHAARCVPIVKHLKATGHNPIVAGTPAQISFIGQWTGDEIQSVPLAGYNIRYTGANRFLQAGLLWQMPGIVARMKQEHNWLLHQAKMLKPDGIISDNRYGMYHPEIPSVILTHQLRAQSGAGKTADNIVQRLHYKLLERFEQTWVVDAAEGGGLAGELSHSGLMPKHYRYLGLLSRLQGLVTSPPPINNTVLFLISGPEPQRSNFSRIAWQQALLHDGNVIFADGNMNAQAPAHVPAHISYHNMLGGQALTDALNTAAVVVCRSGYSTLMDLVACNRRAIIVPTPGQTEQQYLADLMQRHGFFQRASQSHFDLQASLASLRMRQIGNPYQCLSFDLYRHTIDKWLTAL